jgi:hypothetical protein
VMIVPLIARERMWSAFTFCHTAFKAPHPGGPGSGEDLSPGGRGCENAGLDLSPGSRPPQG